MMLGFNFCFLQKFLEFCFYFSRFFIFNGFSEFLLALHIGVFGFHFLWVVLVFAGFLEIFFGFFLFGPEFLYFVVVGSSYFVGSDLLLSNCLFQEGFYSLFCFCVGSLFYMAGIFAFYYFFVEFLPPFLVSQVPFLYVLWFSCVVVFIVISRVLWSVSFLPLMPRWPSSSTITVFIPDIILGDTIM